MRERCGGGRGMRKFMLTCVVFMAAPALAQDPQGDAKAASAAAHPEVAEER